MNPCWKLLNDSAEQFGYGFLCLYSMFLMFGPAGVMLAIAGALVLLALDPMFWQEVGQLQVLWNYNPPATFIK